jgi:ornithine cyclodeaminase/alanine dehydrogenase-like protein (mu-crystallin family)
MWRDRRTDPADITLFESVGCAPKDLLAARMLVCL